MPTPAMSEAESQRRYAAICEAVRQGYPAPGAHVPAGALGAVAVAARSLGMSRNTFSAWFAEYRHRFPAFQLPARAADEIQQAAQIRDAAFYRRQAADAQRDLAECRHALRALAGIAETPIIPPSWALPGSGKRYAAVGLLQISDTHVGETIRAPETNGLNEYTPEIFSRRLRRLISAAIDITPRWASDCDLQGIVVALNGDLISGDIHDELRRTNALTSHEQVILCVTEFAAAFDRLAEKFGKVWVVVTPGNHGRSTEKTHAKRTVDLSYDSLIGRMLEKHFASDPRVVVHVAPGRDAEYPVLGWTVLQTHGDAIGTGGGKGFAGPGLPILRGAKSVIHQGALVGRHYDILLFGHYHTSGNPGGGILANGSIVGFNEFALSIRAAPEPPQQWLALITEKWGIRERCEIKLEDPMKREAPRIRVQAGRAA